MSRKAKVIAAPIPQTSPRRIEPEPQQSAGMSRAQRVVLLIVGVFAIVGVGLALVALASDPSTVSVQRQLTALRATVTSQGQEIQLLKTDTANLKIATAGAATAGNMTALQRNLGGLSKTLTGVQGDIGQLHTCLPELDQEVNALGVNTSTQSITLGDGSIDTFLTNAFINNPTVISNNCTKFLTGQ